MVTRPHEKAGLGPTLLALLVLAGALTVIGVVIWLRMTPQTAPTQPKQAGKQHSELRAVDRVLTAYRVAARA